MKNKRQEVIIDLIQNNILTTQDELQEALQNLGFTVTQSTVSRDIKELKLIKSHDSSGYYRYISNQNASKYSHSHYRDMFVKAVKTIDYALNNVVIKCHNGMASVACVAVDELYGDMMLGSLAGDDTIIIVTTSEQQSKLLCDSLLKLL